jgi:hypothetical protein
MGHDPEAGRMAQGFAKPGQSILVEKFVCLFIHSTPPAADDPDVDQLNR